MKYLAVSFCALLLPFFHLQKTDVQQKGYNMASITTYDIKWDVYLTEWLNKTGSLSEVYESIEWLSTAEAVPDFNADKQGILPTTCHGRNASEECTCFKDAAAELDAARKALARQECANRNKRNYVNTYIAYGDKTAASNTQWRNERKKMLAGYELYKAAARIKHAVLIGDLRTSLQHMSECAESKKNRRWYSRYGFTYYQLLDDKYRPATQ